MENFKNLGLRKNIVKAIAEIGIETPTEVQAEVIPFLMQSNSDIVAQAQTGTGKTAAFGLPLLERINPKLNVVQGLILCPTRELGQQIAKQLFKFTKYTDKIFVESVFGGAQIEKQISSLRRPTHIIVATPGRLIDLIKRKAVDIRKVQTIILDEADEMMSMGFKKELDEILTQTSFVENKWLFSATMPPSIKQIIKTHLSPSAKFFQLSKRNVVNKNIDHQFLICDEKEKFAILMQILGSDKDSRGVIFCKTKNAAQTLAKQLIAKNIATDAIQGDLKQKDRDKVMRAFKNGTHRVLVATDLAARGIDVEGLNFVIHYQLPDKEEYYTHRSGRTARAGNRGVSLALIESKEVKQIRYFEKNLKISFKQIRRKK
ncbi:DEAD/DEAH box helicase [Saccharicrinis aurantiacus]|uniref:DEAD/DEAH box helicase n=1 Tax=Saccharicrinis aurantiacus TaxID=1849719 RepID=UPI0024928E0E|nr:DEAD/DEAH box helicase [Saccharicrinis aurantiacus]